MNEFRCTTAVEGDTRWFVYWIDAEEIFGVTDGKSKAFERKMDLSERCQFMGNVADSLLLGAWKEAFDDSCFTVKTVNRSMVIVNYVVDKVELMVVKNDVPNRIAYIFYLAVSALNSLLRKKPKESPLSSGSTLSKLRPKKAVPKNENSSVIDPTKRKRAKPTGLQFDD